MGKTAANRSINSWTGQLYSFGIATTLLLSYNVLMDLFGGRSPLVDLFWLGNSLDGWLWLLALGLVPTLGGYGLFVMSLGYLPATVANLIATLEPVLTAIWAYFLLSEQLTGVQLFGSLIIFVGVILLRVGARRRKLALKEIPG
jgi:DME family drug/metabolite transporter